MTRVRLGAALVAGLALLLVTTMAVPGARAAAPLPTATLAANVLPGLSGLAPTGAPNRAKQVTVGIGLRRPDPAGEQALLHAMYDPASPQFHHFLTPAQFAARFGVAPAAFQRVTDWLTAGGLTVTQTGTSRDYVQAAGTVAQVQRLFHTTLRTFVAKGVHFMANTSAPSVPAGLPISTVIGLNNLQKFTTPAMPKRAAGPKPAQGLDTGLMTPQDLWAVYQQPSDNMGEGQTLGVFGSGATDSVIKDLRQFESINKLRQVPVSVRHVGKGSFADTSGSEEWDIDTQASTGMAPNAYGLDLYFAPTLLDADVMSLFSKWVSDADGPRQMDASFGECETDPLNPVLGNPALQPANPPTQELGNNLEPVAESVLQQANMLGRTLFSSTGDTGSSCPVVVLPVIGAGNGVLNQAVPLLGYPAASPHAVGVGGTVLYTDGETPPHRALESAWTFTGGGTSIFITAPDYQKGVPNIIGRCVTDFSGAPTNTGQQCRGIPDVAAISGDVVSNGYAIVANGQPDFPGGGTSLSSPLWTGMWARVQAASSNPTGAGFANPSFYVIGKDATAYANDFFDITVGANGIYAALPGWDYVSGWGVPKLTGLMTTVDGRTAPVNDILPPLPPAPPAVNPACFPTWIDPAGDDNFVLDVRGPGHNPQLDLLQGDFAYTPDGKTLKVKLTINDLSKTVATGSEASEYYMLWTYNKVTYLANAQVDATGAVTYGDGTVTKTGNTNSFNQVNTDTGSFTPGRRGVVEIDVPVANVGKPGLHSVLTTPSGETDALVGTTITGGALENVDTGGPGYDYTLGQTCVLATSVSSPAPPAVAPARAPELPPTGISPVVLDAGMLLAVAALLAGWLRRRARA